MNKSKRHQTTSITNMNIIFNFRIIEGSYCNDPKNEKRKYHDICTFHNNRKRRYFAILIGACVYVIWFHFMNRVWTWSLQPVQRYSTKPSKIRSWVVGPSLRTLQNGDVWRRVWPYDSTCRQTPVIVISQFQKFDLNNSPIIPIWVGLIHIAWKCKSTPTKYKMNNTTRIYVVGRSVPHGMHY